MAVQNDYNYFYAYIGNLSSAQLYFYFKDKSRILQEPIYYHLTTVIQKVLFQRVIILHIAMKNTQTMIMIIYICLIFLHIGQIISL